MLVDLVTHPEAKDRYTWFEQCVALQQDHRLVDSPLPHASMASMYLEPSSGFACCAVDNKSQVVGFVLGMVCLTCLDMHDVYVAPLFRRQGVGRSLLRFSQSIALQRKLDTWQLEVRCSNVAAISLYQSYGMQRVGLRPRYYASPVEDAYLFAGALPSKRSK